MTNDQPLQDQVASVAGRIAIIAAMEEELTPLTRRVADAQRTRQGSLSVVSGRLAEREVVLAATGEGRAAAHQGLKQLLEGHEVTALLAVGIAGALSPDLSAGQLVAVGSISNHDREEPKPDTFWLGRALSIAGTVAGSALCQNEIAIDPQGKKELWQSAGRQEHQVVDLESASWAQVAAEHGIPYLVVRAVSDTAEEKLPLDFNAFRGRDGRLDRGKIARHILLHPGLLSDLKQLWERVKRCADDLADLVEEMLAS